MKNKGFTLIELLAVIVILAIVALIATPIILNIIEDARVEANKRSIDNYARAVKNAIASYQLKYKKAPTDLSDLTIEFEGDVECNLDESKLYEDGSIYLTGCKVNGTEVDYTYGEKKEITQAVKPCTLTDTDGSGAASINDTITCGTENFYVIDNNGSEITMFAKYTLDAGYVFDNQGYFGGLEGTSLQGTSILDTGMFYSDTSVVMSEYQTNLRGETLNVTSAIVSVPTVEQFTKFGCTATTESLNCDNSSYEWIKNIRTYAYDATNNIVWKYQSGSSSIDEGSPYIPLQPVVTISVNEI